MGKIGYNENLRDERLAPYPRTEYAVKVNRQEYYAIITHMDAQINRILAALNNSGKKDNTYIFFTADHGLACGNHGLMGKQNMYDHSIRPPLIVAGPRIPKNRRKDADVYLQDIMPTTLELAGVPKPSSVEFNSFLDLAFDKATNSNYSATYGCYTDAQRMIKKGNYKLIAYPKAETTLLFDLSKDPMELKNLSGNEEISHIEKALFSELLVLQHIMEDTTDIQVAFPHLLN
jgi:arylsulfatase A-like enzyme